VIFPHRNSPRLGSAGARGRPLALALALLAGPVLAGDPPTGPTEGALWTAHNAERARAGLPPLELSRPLSNAAHGHAAYMGQTGRFGHYGIGDGDPGSRATAAGYTWRSVGENIAWGQPDASAAVAAWMASSGHRRNILGPYREMGAAAYRDRADRLYWVVLFGTR
jgi:uncharacterized protein YkwD